MSAGVAGSKLLFLVTAGVTGSVILNNPALSNIFRDIAKVVVKHLREDEKGSADDASVDSTTAALTAQVRRLSQELRQLASASRPITVVNSTPGQGSGALSLVIPVAVLGAAGYGIMWWKGVKFGDLMYVTKRGMATAVGSVTKQMESLSAALATAKQQLAGRLDSVSKAVEESAEVQGVIKMEVSEVRETVHSVGRNVSSIQSSVDCLENKIDTLQSQQDFANQGIILLCRFVQQAIEGTTSRSSDLIKGLAAYSQSPGPAPLPAATGAASRLGGLKELEFISSALESNSGAPSFADVPAAQHSFSGRTDRTAGRLQAADGRGHELTGMFVEVSSSSQPQSCYQPNMGAQAFGAASSALNFECQSRPSVQEGFKADASVMTSGAVQRPRLVASRSIQMPQFQPLGGAYSSRSSNNLSFGPHN